MGFTTAQYNALCTAIATGAKFVKYSDKEIHYMSYAQMKELKRDMEEELGIGVRRGRKRVGIYSKGLSDVRSMPRGRIVPPAGPATQTKGDTFTIYIKDSPDATKTKELRNGVVIGIEVAPCDVLFVAFLKSGGVWVDLIFINGLLRDDLSYVQGSGNINKGGAYADGDYVTVKYEYNG